MRVILLGVIDGARCQVQIDIGFGDAVTPGPEDVEYPVMLTESTAPKLRVYTRFADRIQHLGLPHIPNELICCGN